MELLQIAVCDDQITELKMLKKLLESYLQKHENDAFQVDYYESPAKLIQQVSSGKRYDVFVLDIVMPEYNGVEVGRKIRMCNGDGVIIYITASRDFALDAISVHPEQYLLKPIDPKIFYQTIRAVLERFYKKEPLFLPIKTKNGMEQILYQDIICIEHMERIVRVFTTDGKIHESVYLRGSFQTMVEPVLHQENFIQTHQSYLVNLQYAQALKTGVLLMRTGMQIPISRRTAMDVKRKYLRYIVH